MRSASRIEMTRLPVDLISGTEQRWFVEMTDGVRFRVSRAKGDVVDKVHVAS